MPVSASPVGPARAGVLAAGVGLLVLLVGTAVAGANGFLELVANGATVFVPLSIFDAVLQALGPLAKGLLFILIAASVPLAGGLLAIGLARAGWLGPRSGLGAALLAGGIALLVAELVVLPLFGQGIAGSEYRGEPLALQVPIALAAIAYGLVRAEDAGTAPSGDAPGSGEPSPGPVTRRSFLARTLVTVGGLSLLASGMVVATRVVSAAARPLGASAGRPLVDDFGVTPQVTPLEDFYVVGKDLVPTTVDLASWRLAITGLVDRPADWTLDDLGTLQRVEGYRTLQCISNEVVRYGSLIGNQWWAGVRVADVLDAVGVQPSARWVLWRSADGYTESLPLEVARDPRTWLVSEMGTPGAALPREHGFPLRVLIAGRYGMKQPKYLTGIELATDDQPGYWERRGWDETAAVRTYSRIDTPLNGDDVPAARPFRVYGIASAGDRGIARVEISADAGATWVDAELEVVDAGPGDVAWTRWRADVTAAVGRTTLLARATDGQGNVQDDVPRPTLPSGATGLHRVTVTAIAGT
jgi:DMSO/TMAO reductase YedYZ molybdopterin-dependent catalytic subunit